MELALVLFDEPVRFDYCRLANIPPFCGNLTMNPVKRIRRHIDEYRTPENRHELLRFPLSFPRNGKIPR